MELTIWKDCLFMKQLLHLTMSQFRITTMEWCQSSSGYLMLPTVHIGKGTDYSVKENIKQQAELNDAELLIAVQCFQNFATYKVMYQRF
jgi:hypothetical protein